VPFVVVLAAWTVPAAAGVVGAWIAASASGRVPGPLRSLLGGYLAYAARALAFVALLTRRFRDDVPVRLPADDAQPRWTVVLRPALALPWVVLASAFAVVLVLVAVAAWPTAVALGRVPAGLVELGAYCLGYVVGALAYLLLLTPARPSLAPEP
jgi:hypothetical protein